MKAYKFFFRAADWLITAGFVFWLIENMYFGWNKTPQSIAEERIDYFCYYVTIAGIFCFLVPLWGAVKYFVNKNRL